MRYERTDAADYLLRLCENLGLLESDPYWSEKVKDQLNVIMGINKLTSSQLYAVANLIESVVGASLRLTHNDTTTTGQQWDEARQAIMNQVG